MSDEREIVDPFSMEKYWKRIRATKKQIPVPANESGELNEPPACPHLKLVLISDTHDRLGEIIEQGLLPDGDILIHAGDITKNGEEHKINEFNDLMGSLPHKHKIVIAGNHELGFDLGENVGERNQVYNQGNGTRQGWKLLTNCTYLDEKAVVIDGLKFYGAAWHALPGYPFYRPRSELREKWENIPCDTDVLITHSPPLGKNKHLLIINLSISGYLDLWPPVEVWGCEHLLNKVEQIRPTLHVFGHVHSGYGALSNGHTTFVNAAMLKHDYQHSDSGEFNRPFVFYIPKKLK